MSRRAAPATFKVVEKRCTECLFGPNKIVSNARRAEVIASCVRRDTFFVCHKASIAGINACCRGYYDTQDPTIKQLGDRLGLTEFIPVPGE